MLIRTRFAPSPTGTLHLGSVRTALYAWLFAKHHQGEFILRIEDTDRERSTDDSIKAILDGMHWLGLDYQQGPYYQTQNLDRYQAILEQLIVEGKAYRCYCSKERLEKLRETQISKKIKPRYDGHCRSLDLPSRNEPFVVRFCNPQHGEVTFADQVYGTITVSNQELDDVILLRSDGMPTYNFTVVVDDWDMQITHVIRGDDHINNTPRQINILSALGAPIPTYAHLPMILGDDGKRLSKRHGAVNIMDYREQGYLPQAMLNYLVRLGWSHGSEEIFSIAEMINLFSLKAINRAPASFNPEKLQWLNQHYLKNTDPQLVAQELHWQLERLGADFKHGPELTDIVKLQAERCKTLQEMAEKSLYFYQELNEYDSEAAKAHLTPEIKPALSQLNERFRQLSAWDEDEIQQAIKTTIKDNGIKMPQLAQAVRVALLGNTISPPINATVKQMGKQRTLERLNKGIAAC